MGFFDFLKQPDINRGIQEFMNMEGAVLLDVRTPQEYREGPVAELLQNVTAAGLGDDQIGFIDMAAAIALTGHRRAG